jgi:hypothetical protein
MKVMKLYIDATQHIGISVFYKDEPVEITQAGTTVYTMSLKDRNEEYLMLEKQKGLFFIFEDNLPVIDFYTVPRIDIFARDNQSGYLGTVGAISDIEDLNSPICYIDKNRNVFNVANCMRDYLFPAEIIGESISHSEPMKGVTFHSSLQEAKKLYEFIDVEQILKKHK